MLVQGSVFNYLHTVWFPKWGFCWNCNQSKVSHIHKWQLGSTGCVPHPQQPHPAYRKNTVFIYYKNPAKLRHIWLQFRCIGQILRRKLWKRYERKLLTSILTVAPLREFSLFSNGLQWWMQEATQDAWAPRRNNLHCLLKASICKGFPA